MSSLREIRNINQFHSFRMSTGEISLKNEQSFMNLSLNESPENIAIVYRTYQINYISSLLTANMFLMALIVILLFTIAILLILIAIKAKLFLLKVVAEGVVIDDVRPFASPTPPPKPKRSKTNERLVE